MIKKLSLRSVGRVFILASLIGLGVGLPLYGWIVRDEPDAFNKQVGWANIWAATIGALGIILMVVDGKRDGENKLDRYTVSLANIQLSSHGKQLAQLLGTDSLESRSATLRFSVADPRTGKPKSVTHMAGSIDTIADYYKKTSTGRMLILGEAGAGKTVLGTILLLRLAEEAFDASDTEKNARQVPIMFNLTSWPRNKTVEEWLADDISLRFRLKLSVARELIRDKRILPMLDGLDEMDHEQDSPVRAELAVRKLNDYIATNSRDKLVVIGRSGSQYYLRLRSKLRNMQAISISPLRNDDIDNYVKEHCGEDVYSQVKTLLRKLPVKTRDLFYRDTSTPWRLAMSVGYLNAGEEISPLLPLPKESPSAFYDRRSSVLHESFLQHRFVLAGVRDQNKIDRLRNYLSIIAHFLRSSDGENHNPDIVLHDWWRRFGGGRVLGWQSRLALAAAVIPFNLPSTLFSVFNSSRETGGGWPSWPVLLANFAMLLVVALGTPYRTTRPLGMNLAAVFSVRGSLRAILSLVFAVGVGYFFVMVTSSILLGVGAGAGLFVMSFFAFVGAVDGTQDAMNPHAPLRRDFKASLIFGSGFSVLMGTYLTEIMGPSSGIRFGLGYLFSLLFGFASGRYLAGTLIGPTVGLPIRLSSFLRWANSAGILRVAGISYQFRHRELMNHLLATSVEPLSVPLAGPFGIPLRKIPRWLDWSKSRPR